MKWMTLVMLVGCSKAPAPPVPAGAKHDEPPGESVILIGRGSILVIRNLATSPSSASELGTWKVTVEEWGERTVLVWSMREQVETESSQRRRAVAAEAGEDPPESLYEIIEHAGRLIFEECGAARAMLLPAYWDQDRTLHGNGGLWLSRAAYDELRSQGHTTWGLGLLDRTDPGTLTADRTASETDLKVFGVWRRLPVIRARSSAAAVVILDDPCNPLVLRVEPDAKSGIGVSPVAPSGLFPSLLGYEVIEIR